LVNTNLRSTNSPIQSLKLLQYISAMQLTDLTFLNSFAKGDKEKIANTLKCF